MSNKKTVITHKEYGECLRELIKRTPHTELGFLTAKCWNGKPGYTHVYVSTFSNKALGYISVSHKGIIDIYSNSTIANYCSELIYTLCQTFIVFDDRRKDVRIKEDEKCMVCQKFPISKYHLCVICLEEQRDKSQQ